MKNFALIILLIISTCLTIFSQNQNYFIGFSDTTKTSSTIKFNIINNLMVIPLHINDSDTLYFILDTGIKPTLLTRISGDIEFNVGKELTIRGLGVGDDLIVYHTFGNKITIGNDLLLTLQNVFVLENDRFELSKRMGMQINGIIGYSIFEHFIVEINFISKEITFYNPKKFKQKRKYRRWLNIPLTIYNGKPYAKFKIGINADTIITANLLVDLGASDALWLITISNDSIPKNNKNKNLYLGQGLNGDIFGNQGRISNLFFDDKNILEQVTTCFPDTSSIRVGNDYDIPNRNGTVGSEILRRFNIIFDYPHNRMLLKRNSNFNDEFYFEMSGIEVEAPYFGLKIYTIFNVHENSPADKAGILVGDQILKINGRSTANLELNDILLILHNKEGKKIKLKLSRNGIVFETIIILTDYRTK
ncbi:MAG: PDZ domain-containing protein [Bacteroidales bacterium]|nr:PDZ domain-containing protein [Bacteroidales bacterium]